MSATETTRTEEIETALEGHRLDTRPPGRGHCQRCMQTNQKRLHLDVDEPHPLWPKETRQWLGAQLDEHAPAETTEAAGGR